MRNNNHQTGEQVMKFTSINCGKGYKHYHFEKFGYNFIITRYLEDVHTGPWSTKPKVMWKMYLDDGTNTGITIEQCMEDKKEAMQVFYEISKEEIVDTIENQYGGSPLQKGEEGLWKNGKRIKENK